MMGVLLCRDAATGAAVTLRAFSGQFSGRWHVGGWAGPVAGVTAEPHYGLYTDFRGLTQRLGERLAQLQLVMEARWQRRPGWQS